MYSEALFWVMGWLAMVRIGADGKNEGKGEGVIDGNGEVTPLTTIAEADGASE